MSFDWVTYRLLLEPRNVSDSSVKFEELVQLVYQKEPVKNNDFFHEPDITLDCLLEALNYKK